MPSDAAIVFCREQMAGLIQFEQEEAKAEAARPGWFSQIVGLPQNIVLYIALGLVGIVGAAYAVKKLFPEETTLAVRTASRGTIGAAQRRSPSGSAALPSAKELIAEHSATLEGRACTRVPRGTRSRRHGRA